MYIDGVCVWWGGGGGSYLMCETWYQWILYYLTDRMFIGIREDSSYLLIVYFNTWKKKMGWIRIIFHDIRSYIVVYYNSRLFISDGTPHIYKCFFLIFRFILHANRFLNSRKNNFSYGNLSYFKMHTEVYNFNGIHHKSRFRLSLFTDHFPVSHIKVKL